MQYHKSAFLVAIYWSCNRGIIFILIFNVGKEMTLGIII